MRRAFPRLLRLDQFGLRAARGAVVLFLLCAGGIELSAWPLPPMLAAQTVSRWGDLPAMRVTRDDLHRLADEIVSLAFLPRGMEGRDEGIEGRSSVSVVTWDGFTVEASMPSEIWALLGPGDRIRAFRLDYFMHDQGMPVTYVDVRLGDLSSRYRVSGTDPARVRAVGRSIEDFGREHRTLFGGAFRDILHVCFIVLVLAGFLFALWGVTAWVPGVIWGAGAVVVGVFGPWFPWEGWVSGLIVHAEPPSRYEGIGFWVGVLALGVALVALAFEIWKHRRDSSRGGPQPPESESQPYGDEPRHPELAVGEAGEAPSAQLNRADDFENAP